MRCVPTAALLLAAACGDEPSTRPTTLTAQPAALDFGVLASDAGARGTVALVNDGPHPIVISSVTIEDGAGDDRQLPRCGDADRDVCLWRATPTDVPAGESRDLELACFGGAEAATYDGDLVVRHNGLPPETRIALRCAAEP